MTSLFKSEQIIDDYVNKNVSVNKPDYKNSFKVWKASGLLDNPNYYAFVNHPIGLYELFRNNEIRGIMRTPLNKRIKYEYFDNGYIVCALSFSQIEKKTGWYRSKISRYIKKLVDQRWIRIDRIDVGKKEKQHIYLLGRVNNSGDDIYYMDEMVNSSQK